MVYYCYDLPAIAPYARGREERPVGITLFFFILAPLCLIWATRPTRLLQLLLVFGIFEAAAAVTVGGLGIAPNTLPAITFVGYVGLQLILGARYPGLARTWSLAFPLVLVSVWAMSMSWLAPRLFEGRAYVWPQKSTPPFVITALSPETANLNQNLYLFLNIVTFVLVSFYMTRSRVSSLSILQAYLVSLLLAFAFGVWEFFAHIAHVPFPSATVYSNPGWSILTDQTIGSLPRVNATFSEPSSFGGYMAAGAFCSGWLILNRYPGMLVKWAFFLSVSGVLLSTSATGIVSLGAGMIIVTLLALTTHTRRFLPVIKKLAVPMAIGSFFFLVLTSVLLPSFFSNIGAVFDTVVNKQNSDSYTERSSTDLDSLHAAIDTFGMGVGWGNNRSSSLIPGLLATIGLPGMLGLVWFGARIFLQVVRLQPTDENNDDVLLVRGSSAALIGYLIPACLSAPTITAITFYVLLALLVGGITRAKTTHMGHHVNIETVLS